MVSGLGEGRALLRMSFRYPERIVVDHTSNQMSLFHEHTTQQVAVTDHSICTGPATSCSNTLLRYLVCADLYAPIFTYKFSTYPHTFP